jgi:SAM-dependent methyltransferase
MAEEHVHAAAAYAALAETYAADREDQTPWNSLYERPAIISMLPDLKGKRLLDVGCGSAPISAWAASQGAEVVGFDLTENMVALAQGRQIPKASFRVADLSEPLHFLEDHAFDVAVGSLVMHYLRDWVAPLRELRRVLRPDGLLLLSTHHPSWDIERSATGNYFATELVDDRWTRAGKEYEVRYWRRPLRDMFAAFDTAGFSVLAFSEPQPVPECRERFPQEWELLSTRPVFVIFKLAPAM